MRLLNLLLVGHTSGPIGDGAQKTAFSGGGSQFPGVSGAAPRGSVFKPPFDLNICSSTSKNNLKSFIPTMARTKQTFRPAGGFPINHSARQEAYVSILGPGVPQRPSYLPPAPVATPAPAQSSASGGLLERVRQRQRLFQADVIGAAEPS